MIVYMYCTILFNSLSIRLHDITFNGQILQFKLSYNNFKIYLLILMFNLIIT